AGGGAGGDRDHRSGRRYLAGTRRGFHAKAFHSVGVVRQPLTESVLLSLCGGMAGIAVAYVGTKLVLRRAPPAEQRQPRTHPDRPGACHNKITCSTPPDGLDSSAVPPVPGSG